jgi:hypothetical protein
MHGLGLQPPTTSRFPQAENIMQQLTLIRRSVLLCALHRREHHAAAHLDSSISFALRRT